jgi:uncharacterized membrane protein YccC
MIRTATAWERLRIFVQDHRVGLGQSVRVAISAVLTLVLGQWLHVPLVLWSVLTAVIVTQTSVGRSLKATIDYLIGTLGGAVYAGAVAALIPHDGEIALLAVLALAVAPPAFLAAVNSSFNVAPFTAIIVVLAPAITHSTPIESAFFRVVEVALGAIVGLMVSFAVFPARAHAHATEAAASLLDELAKVLPDLFSGFTGSLDPATLQAIQGSIGQAIGRLDAIYIEAKRERMTHLASEPDPAPLLRTLLRLRHDLVIVGRAATVAMPEPLRPRLGPPLGRLVEAAADYFRGCARALVDQAGPPPRADLEAAFDLYAGEIAALRRENLFRALPSDALERIFTLGFALEQMRQHCKDLERCVAEFSRRAADPQPEPEPVDNATSGGA